MPNNDSPNLMSLHFSLRRHEPNDSYLYEFKIRIPGAFESDDMQILTNVWFNPSRTLVRLTLKPSKLQ